MEEKAFRKQALVSSSVSTDIWRNYNDIITSKQPFVFFLHNKDAIITSCIRCGNGYILEAVVRDWFIITTLNEFHILTHWGRVTHICVDDLTIIGSDNGLSPWRRQAIIWINAVLLLIGPLGTNFSELLIEIVTFSFKNMHLKVSSAKRRPFCLGFNVLINKSSAMA